MQLILSRLFDSKREAILFFAGFSIISYFIIGGFEYFTFGSGDYA